MSLSELAREDCEAEVSSTQTKTAWRSAWLLGETMFPHRRLNPTASWRNSENTQRCSASSKEERLSNTMRILSLKPAQKCSAVHIPIGWLLREMQRASS